MGTETKIDYGRFMNNVHGRKFIYQFALEVFGEDICVEVDTRGKPYPELTRAALMLKQKLLEFHYDDYKQMKREVIENGWNE